MPEYIEKLAAIHAIKNYGIAAINEKRRSLGIADDIIKLYDVIGNMPAADVVPVVHGEWAHLGGDEFCCTNCGFIITTEGAWERPTQKYCGDCGAKMDGGEDNA